MSMELIDRKKIRYSWFEVNGECSDGVTLQSVIKTMPNVKAIPLEVVEQIRAELLREYNHYEYQEDSDTSFGIGIAIDIIDKALKEQS